MGLLSNTKWVALSQSFKIVVQLLNIIVLTRLVVPQEYGLMAMALVVTNFAMLFRDLGTSAAIIQRKNINNGFVNAIFGLNIIMGGGVGLAILLISPFASQIFHEPRLIHVLWFLSISFPITSLSAAHLALLERKSEFKSVALIEIFSSTIAVVIAIFLAYLGLGVFSLVAQVLISSLLSTILFWRKSEWRPTVTYIFKFSEINDLFAFSGNLTFFNFINYFARNADAMIIGHYFTSAILGVYSLSYRIMLFPIQSMTSVASRAFFPIFSQYQNNNKELRNSYYNILYYILIFVFPLMTGLAVLSKPFIDLVFGDSWALASEILVWLAPTGIIQSVLSTSGTIFMSKGKTDVLLKLGILGTILQVTAFMLGARYDVVTLAKFYLISNFIHFFPVMFFVFKVINGSLFFFFKRIYKIFIATIFMVLFLKILILVSPYFHSVDCVLKLILLVFFGAVTYLVSLISLDNEFSFQVKSIFRKFV